MRVPVRTFAVLALAVGLLALFLRNVDFGGIVSHVRQAHPSWLALSLGSMFVNLAIRALRWQYLLEPLGHASFANSFRATAVGFAASTVLPARAGEVIRPYFLARHERMSATGAFATVVLERLLDTLTVLALLAAFVFLFPGDVGRVNPSAFRGVQWAGGLSAGVAVAVLGVVFVLAGNPERVSRSVARFERYAPSGVAGLITRVTEKFVSGLGAVRRPGRLLVSILWSFPLWLSIAVGIWAAAMAFDLAVPFTGSFLLIAILVLGVAVPTPGAIGGFHAAFRLGTTVFYGAQDDAAVAAAIVLHAFSIGPTLVLGLVFAARAGLDVTSMRRLADTGEPVS